MRIKKVEVSRWELKNNHKRTLHELKNLTRELSPFGGNEARSEPIYNFRVFSRELD